MILIWGLLFFAFLLNIVFAIYLKPLLKPINYLAISTDRKITQFSNLKCTDDGILICENISINDVLLGFNTLSNIDANYHPLFQIGDKIMTSNSLYFYKDGSLNCKKLKINNIEFEKFSNIPDMKDKLLILRYGNVKLETINVEDMLMTTNIPLTTPDNTIVLSDSLNFFPSEFVLELEPITAKIQWLTVAENFIKGNSNLIYTEKKITNDCVVATFDSLYKLKNHNPLILNINSFKSIKPDTDYLLDLRNSELFACEKNYLQYRFGLPENETKTAILLYEEKNFVMPGPYWCDDDFDTNNDRILYHDKLKHCIIFKSCEQLLQENFHKNEDNITFLVTKTSSNEHKIVDNVKIKLNFTNENNTHLMYINKKNEVTALDVINDLIELKTVKFTEPSGSFLIVGEGEFNIIDIPLTENDVVNAKVGDVLTFDQKLKLKPISDVYSNIFFSTDFNFNDYNSKFIGEVLFLKEKNGKINLSGFGSSMTYDILDNVIEIPSGFLKLGNISFDLSRSLNFDKNIILGLSYNGLSFSIQPILPMPIESGFLSVNENNDLEFKKIEIKDYSFYKVENTNDVHVTTTFTDIAQIANKTTDDKQFIKCNCITGAIWTDDATDVPEPIEFRFQYETDHTKLYSISYITTASIIVDKTNIKLTQIIYFTDQLVSKVNVKKITLQARTTREHCYKINMLNQKYSDTKLNDVLTKLNVYIRSL